MRGQKKKEGELVEVESVEEWEVEKVLNKKKDEGSREIFNMVEEFHS